MSGEPDIHESPTEELSWFTLQEHRPRHERRREELLLGDVVDTDDVSKLRVSDVRVRRSTSRRTRFQLRGH